MTTAPSHATRRPLLTFSVDRLAPRDELLLKSFVRVLDHRTHQHWTFVEGPADLRITGELFGALAPTGPAPVLRVGQPGEVGSDALTLPLHADQLELALNRIGDAIVLVRGAEMPGAAMRDDEEFRLRRWPPAAMLSAGHRVTLATLMSARPYSLATLQRQSGVSAKLCSEFVSELRQGGLLHGTPVPPLSTASDVMASSSHGPSTWPVATPAPAPAAAPLGQPGLLARIRARFGLQPALVR